MQVIMHNGFEEQQYFDVHTCCGLWNSAALCPFFQMHMIHIVKMEIKTFTIAMSAPFRNTADSTQFDLIHTF